MELALGITWLLATLAVAYVSLNDKAGARLYLGTKFLFERLADK